MSSCNHNVTIHISYFLLFVHHFLKSICSFEKLSPHTLLLKLREGLSPERKVRTECFKKCHTIGFVLTRMQINDQLFILDIFRQTRCGTPTYCPRTGLRKWYIQVFPKARRRLTLDCPSLYPALKNLWDEVSVLDIFLALIVKITLIFSLKPNNLFSSLMK